MENIPVPQSPTNATYVEPSSETILEPGLKLGDLLHRNMTQPYVLQRLRKNVWWVQSFNYGTVFYVGERGVSIFDTLEGVYDNITKAVASVTDKPITTAIYPHYRASASMRTTCARSRVWSGTTCRAATGTSGRRRTSISSSRSSRISRPRSGRR